MLSDFQRAPDSGSCVSSSDLAPVTLSDLGVSSGDLPVTHTLTFGTHVACLSFSL